MMQRIIKKTLFFFFLFKSCLIFAQDEITIFNPSFEDAPNHSTPPFLWENCGSVGNTPSDIHGSFSGFFNVRKTAQEGNSYVGMVVREDGTWEAIGQVLEQPLLKNYQYQFSIYLARSESYRSISKVTRLETEFIEPVILRVWGGSYSGHRGQLLAESVPVAHTDWQEYTFEFEPVEDWSYLILEAFFADDFVYNGNLLLDNCSEIYAFSKLKLWNITDYAALTERDLLDLIVDCKADDATLTDTSVLDLVYDSWLFQKTCREVGMRELVAQMDTVTLKHYLEVYQKMGLHESVEIIEKTRVLHEKNSNILSEKRFLKNCDDLFQKSLKAENISEERRLFIKENRTEIIELLRQCAE